jgi:glycosyltransferase involved in cell wall biosynthesis
VGIWFTLIDMSIPVSACIICCNEAKNIGAALDSLVWCDDIVVVDSGSTDGTREVVLAHPSKPRFISHPWSGYSAQRKFATEQCRHEWVLALDADEECSAELASCIEQLTPQEVRRTAQFRIPRKNYVGGRYVRCWSPDYQTRLLHKHRVQWEPQSAPEVRRPLAGFGTGRLAGPLLHNRLKPFEWRDFNDGPRMAEHAFVLARAMVQSGRRASWLELLLRPPITFIKYYIFRGGFLQGRFGLAICYKTAIGVILKYTVLYASEQWNMPPIDLPRRHDLASADAVNHPATDADRSHPPADHLSGNVESDSNAGASAG